MTTPPPKLNRGDRLVLASHNRGKLRELSELIRPYGLMVVSAGDLGLPEPEETGSTFEENARIKAVAAATASGLPAFADDSGLAVDALGGDPGVLSARWAGPERNFAVAMREVEERLRGCGAVEPAARTARFIAVLCLAAPDGASMVWRGELEGRLVWPPRGTQGFGYDAMFLPAGHARTFGEMNADEKHGWRPPAEPLSHRAQAFAKFAEKPAAAGAGRVTDPGDIGFGVYVHWPFCAAKCPYCDFNSHVRHQPVDQARYVKAFTREIATIAARAPGRTVSSIFIGGGTPSLMAPATVGAVLDAIAAKWKIMPGAEVTMEANPSSVEAERFRGYRAAGVNRVSLGVQSLNDTDLRFLGRLHNVAEAFAAIETAQSIFDRTSFDLIYARPGQTPDAWRRELEAALARAADHLSLYQLTIEQGTPFFALYQAGKLKIPDDDLAADLYAVTQELCDRHGRPAYEISNHAAPGAECQHNLLYWRYGEYAGLGPGAHGRLLLPEGRRATANIREPEAWLQRVEFWGDGLEVDERLTREQESDEMLLMGLRLTEGIDLTRYKAVAGRSLDPTRLDDLTENGMVERLDDRRVRVTRAGSFVLDAVVADLAA